MTTGGDICKAFASGADAVMIGSAFARAQEAPGRGYHWGMATPHSNLPRGTRIRVGIAGPLEQILFGPAFTEDGTLNLVGAIRTCMGSVGARNIRAPPGEARVVARRATRAGGARGGGAAGARGAGSGGRSGGGGLRGGGGRARGEVGWGGGGGGGVVAGGIRSEDHASPSLPFG